MNAIGIDDSKSLASYRKSATIKIQVLQHTLTQHARTHKTEQIIMSEIQGLQKTLEVKIRVRTIQERQDQKDVSRVFFSKDALVEMRIEAGKPCYMWKIDDLETRRRQVIAWPSPQPLNKNVVQMAKSLQEACNLRLEDRCFVAPCGELLTAECVMLRDATTGMSPLSEIDRSHWEWYIEDKLCRDTPSLVFLIFFPGFDLSGSAQVKLICPALFRRNMGFLILQIRYLLLNICRSRRKCFPWHDI